MTDAREAAWQKHLETLGLVPNEFHDRGAGGRGQMYRLGFDAGWKAALGELETVKRTYSPEVYVAAAGAQLAANKSHGVGSPETLQRLADGDLSVLDGA